MGSVLWRVCSQIAITMHHFIIIYWNVSRIDASQRRQFRYWFGKWKESEPCLQWYAYCRRNQCLFASMRFQWVKCVNERHMSAELFNHTIERYFSFPVTSIFSILNIASVFRHLPTELTGRKTITCARWLLFEWTRSGSGSRRAERGTCFV